MERIDKIILGPLSNQGGFALVIALIMMAILSIIGIAALNTTSIELQISGNDRFEKQEFYATESGCRRGGQWLRNLQMAVVDDYVDPNLMATYKSAQNFNTGLGVHTVDQTVNPESNLGNGNYHVQYNYDITETVDSANNRVQCVPIKGFDPSMLHCFYDVQCTSSTTGGSAKMIQLRVKKPTDFK